MAELPYAPAVSNRMTAKVFPYSPWYYTIPEHCQVEHMSWLKLNANSNKWLSDRKMVTELAEPGLVPFVTEVASSNQQEFQNLRWE